MADADPSAARPAASPGWTLGERIVIAAGLLLVGDLLLLPWHHFSLNMNLEQFGVTVPSFTYDRSGVQDPQAFFGIAAVVMSLGMVLQVVAAKVTPTVPRLEQFHLVAGPIVLGLLVAKLLANHDFLGLGAWIGLALAAGVAYGGFILSQETTTSPDRPVPPAG